MKKLIILLLTIINCQLSIINCNAQSPEKFNYQGVARDNGGNTLTNQPIALRISLHSASPSGTVVYSETHAATTNTFGLFALEIGGGNNQSGSIASISWGSDSYYVQTEMDASGGTNYQNMGTAQLLSVPYALYAKASGTPGPTGATGQNGTNGNDGAPGATGPAGATGANGTSVVIQGSVATSANLPGSGNTSGDGYITQDSGHLWVWDGGAWVDAGLIQGPAGANGSNGATGPTGLIGATGTAGSNGATGATGATGADGALNAWSKTGNSGTQLGTNFIGTTDTQPLEIRVNNIRAGYLDFDLNWSNTAYGVHSFASNSTGDNNTAIGVEALKLSTSGSLNTALGAHALYQNNGNHNTAIGARALQNSGGSNNTAIGEGALSSTLSGSTAVGFAAGFNNTGAANVFLGYLAGFNETGSNKLYISNSATATPLIYGNFSTKHLTVNDSLTSKYLQMTNGAAVGYVPVSDANGTMTWTNPSTVVGGQAWKLTGNAGTVDGTNFIGTTDNVPFSIKVNNQKAGRIEAASGTANTFYGYQSGNSNTGYYNTANGYQAFYSNTTGTYNTANGFRALYSNTEGYENTANGYLALYSNTEGSQNTANGTYALYSNTIGGENTASGFYALYENIDGSYNTAHGYSSLYSNTTGEANTANGYYALGNNTTGNNNTALGYAADVVSGNLTNATAIGYNAKVAASNAMVLGGTGADAVNVGIGTTSPATKLHVVGSSTGYNTFTSTIENTANAYAGQGLNIKAGENTWSANSQLIRFSTPNGTAIGAVTQGSSSSVFYATTSDRRLKTNIEPTKMGLTDLMHIPVYDYEYKTDPGKSQIGFVAQELYNVLPTAVAVGGDDAQTNPWMVDYSKLTPLLVKAVQDLTKKVEEQQKQIEQLQKQK